MGRIWSRAARFRLHCVAGMVKLCIFVGTTIGGMAFGYAGDALGFSFLWSFILSGVGSVVGVYVGWKVAQYYK